MNLSAPKNTTFFVAVVLALVGLLGTITQLPVISVTMAFWLIVAGFVVLALGVMLDNF